MKQREHVSPLIAAIEKGSLAEAQRALEGGADIEEVCEEHEGITPLILALYQRDLEMTKLLLDAGADPDNDGHFAVSPIHLATGGTQLLRFVVDAGADPDALQEGEVTALMLVADDDRNLEMVEILLAAGADPARINRNVETALDIAERKSFAKPEGAEQIAAALRRALAG